MLNYEKLDAGVRQDLRERGFTPFQIEHMTPFEAFDAYCNYNGLIHWGTTLWRIMANLRNSELHQEGEIHVSQPQADDL